MTYAPPCPYCGERQAYSDARPSRPYVRVVGTTRETQYDTECRACGKRLIWSIPVYHPERAYWARG